MKCDVYVAPGSSAGVYSGKHVGKACVPIIGPRHRPVELIRDAEGMIPWFDDRSCSLSISDFNFTTERARIRNKNGSFGPVKLDIVGAVATDIPARPERDNGI